MFVEADADDTDPVGVECASEQLRKDRTPRYVSPNEVFVERIASGAINVGTARF